jgi:hypothetical protein
MTTTIPTNVQAARDAVVNSDLYAMCHLMLASYAYAGQNTRDNAIASIKLTFETNATTSLAPSTVPANSPVSGCVWSIQWGPYASLDNSNLMYAAALFDPTGQWPIMGTIAIRGTDVSADKCPGVLNQIFQDLYVAVLKPWPYTMPVNSSSANLAAGSLDGFQNKILKLGTGLLEAGDIAKWVTAFTTKYPGTPIVVTGHSLGGCQTTVLAAYLRSNESKVPADVQICPNPFAGPTAGDAGFAAMYDALFPTTARRWVNTFDVAPMAFNIDDLNELTNFWNAGAWTCPSKFAMGSDLKKLYGIVTTAVQNKGYTQPGSGLRAMNGTCTYAPSTSFLDQTTNPTDFGQMLTMQHFPPAYQNLMGVYMATQNFPTLIWPAPQTASS